MTILQGTQLTFKADKFLDELLRTPPQPSLKTSCPKAYLHNTATMSTPPQDASTPRESIEAKPDVSTPSVPAVLEIKVVEHDSSETIFKIKKHMKFKKLFDTYCANKGKTRSLCRFLFDGMRLQDEDTPESKMMEDGDRIDVVMEQLGGGLNDI